MMVIISDKKVKIRKKRKCGGCLRVFQPGANMNCQVNTYDGIGSFYTCETCTALQNEFSYGYDDSENIYPEGFVEGGLNSGQTPEMLLDELRKQKQELGK